MPQEKKKFVGMVIGNPYESNQSEITENLHALKELYWQK